jgi:hypothetical protein
MTLADIEHLLPNGFHDAQIEQFVWDYRTNSASFIVELWVAKEEDESLEVYREARLDLKGIIFIMIDPPCPRELDPKPYKSSSGTLQIDGFETTESMLPNLATLLEGVSAGTSPYSFYVVNWNSYIHVAAKEAELVWTGKRKTLTT